MENGIIKEITNYDELKKSLEIIIITYKDRDEKMNLSNENNHRHSNMTYDELKERLDNVIKMYGYYSEEKIIAYLSLEEKENVLFKNAMQHFPWAFDAISALNEQQ